MGELWRLPATEAVDLLRRGAVSPLKMVEAAAARIEAVEPRVNALPIRFLDAARQQARAFRAAPDEHPGWLAGLPIAVKDYNDVGGQLTTRGSPIYAVHVAAADDRTVATLQALGAAEIIRAQRERHALFHRVARFFEDYDPLACPTVAVPPSPVEQRFPTEIAGEALTTYIDWMFLTFVVTLTGCPAISIPCGLTREGLPVGLQLVGRPHGDAALLGQARLAEEALGFSRTVLLG